MPRMPVTRSPEEWMRNTVILGPCPGCYIWTIEYHTKEIAVSGIDLHYAVESLLQEHLQECPGMREIVESL